MRSVAGDKVLQAADPSPVRIINPAGASSFLLLGDHAGNAVPHKLEALGLPPEELARHIGWDIGIGGLGPMLARALDAPFVRQTYSRLVIDCNRATDAADAIPPVSDGTAVPGNADLPPDDRAARIAEIHAPYQATIAELLAARDSVGLQTVLVSLHSFTPVMRGQARPWDVGVLYDGGDTRFAAAVMAALRGRGDLVVGDNEPYRMDLIDYTIPRHAYPARPYVELEIRQDLIASEAGQRRWTRIVQAVCREALAAIGN